MKINNDITSSVSQRTTGGVSSAKDRVSLQSKNSVSEREASSESAKVSLSDRAQNILKAKSIAINTPDVRKDRVEELKQQIQSGQYKIHEGAIADKMVDEALLEI